MMAPNTNDNIVLLAALVDSNDEDESEYRFLVDQKHVKYVTVDPGALPKDDRTSASLLIPMLPPFPPGDWNEGHISRDQATGNLVFSRTTKGDLPGVENVWHSTRVDHLGLEKVGRVRQNIHRVTHSLFERPVLFKFAPFPWQMPYLEPETAAYEWIDGRGIGPRFLGHVTEAGRVIGFLVEEVDGARTAGPADLAACRGVLARLHSLGIKHGDINRHNFLVRDGEEAVIVDFETAQKSAGREELESEYRRLEHSLNDTSRRGRPGVPVVSTHIPPL